MKSFSCAHPLATPWTTANQAPPSTRFSRQEHGSGLPLPSPPRPMGDCQVKTSACWDFFGSPVTKIPCSQCRVAAGVRKVGVLGLIPGQETRAHMQQVKIPYAASKIQCSQINKQINKKLLQKSVFPFKKILLAQRTAEQWASISRERTGC